MPGTMILLDPTTDAIVTQAMRGHATATHAPWPQYGPNYFDNWTLHVIRETTRYKSGVTLHRGQLVLACPKPNLVPGIAAYVSTYVPATGHIVAQPWHAIIECSEV